MRIDPSFFGKLPCLIARVPREPPWHVLRFSTWGPRFKEDRLPNRLPDWAPYRAASHPDNAARAGPRGFAYGGSHAVIVQRRTVDELLAYARANGIQALDAALREGIPDARARVHYSLKYSLRCNHSSRGREQAAPRTIRSYVIFTPLVGLSPRLRKIAAWHTW